MRLVLQNKDGHAVRAFEVEGDSGIVIARQDTKRIEIHPSLERLDERKIRYERLAEFTRANLEQSALHLTGGTVLGLAHASIEVVRNETPSRESSRAWYSSLALMSVLMIGLLGFVLGRPTQSAKLEQELRREIVLIAKQIPKMKPKEQLKVPAATTPAAKLDHMAAKMPTTKKTAAIRRMGALAVLGSLSQSKQRGGVDLGAAHTTAGPGLGGTQGSGGVQTSLYGKGLVAAPVGAGGNLQGGGGYGTKGKGGGQAGYGKLSLIGSAGGAPIPMGREAIIEGGLDRDLIADVVNRNMGQVRFCYEQGLQGDPALAGRVAIAWTIGASGQVKMANVESTTLNSKLVEECIVMRLRSWKFPLPSGGVDVKVSFPFVLRRAGQG